MKKIMILKDFIEENIKIVKHKLRKFRKFKTL